MTKGGVRLEHGTHNDNYGVDSGFSTEDNTYEWQVGLYRAVENGEIVSQNFFDGYYVVLEWPNGKKTKRNFNLYAHDMNHKPDPMRAKVKSPLVVPAEPEEDPLYDPFP